MYLAHMQAAVRQISTLASVIDLQGDITASAEHALLEAYTQANGPSTRIVLLNFSGLEYMNSSGIGLLVTLLIRIRRKPQQLWACGLSAHYRQIFELTRLNEAMRVFEDEAEALETAYLL